MVAQFPLTDLQKMLIEELPLIPQGWALTPLRGNKAPYRTDWQHESPLTRTQIITEIESGQAKGYGIRTGTVSGGIVAIDFDGASATKKALELSGGELLPDTVTFTSNRPGREQRLYTIPEQYWEAVKTAKIKTGVIGDDGKPEQLELRWDGCQSVLPPSVHPKTGCYRWRKSPEEVAIAPAPTWVIEAMLVEPEPKQSERYPTAYTRKARTGEEWSNEEWALSYLSALNPCRADDYDDWLEVGMALRSVHDSLLAEWDNWSQQSPKYKPGDCDKRWKSFKRQGVGIGSLARMAKQDGWRSPFEKTSGRGYSGGIGGGNRRNFGGGSGGNGGDGGDGDGKQPLAELSLRDRILEILNRNQDRSQRDEAFIKLAQTTGATTREIKELAASLESEVDLEESRSDRKAEIENLLKVNRYQLTLRDYLDPSVAIPLERVAKWMGTTSAAMLTTLYPVVGSLLKVGTRLELIKATDFYALPVVYTGLVCESGAGKTPAQKTILKPLFALQDEAEIEYKKRLDEYQLELSEWKKLKDTDEPAPEQPVPREYYTTDATSEAIALIQSQQPTEGFLGWFDELPALFKSQGQYKNGRGADGEKILSGRDGTGFKVNRASGKRLVVNQSSYSITGSLQPLILRQMMGDFTDANGQWARFLWTVMQVQPAPYPDDAIPFDVSGLLKGIYKRLRNLPPITYTLSSQAKKLYHNWYDELDRLKMAESRQGIRAVYAKMKGDTGVLALLLHCFNGCVAEGSTPALEIDEATMAAAIKLSKYHIGQVKLIHSEGDAANGDVAAIHAKIIQLSERKGWLKAADVRDIDRQTKKQFSADDIRRHFQELEASGFGQTKGQRTKLMWSIHKDISPDGNPPHSDKTQDSFDKLRTNSGQKSPNSGQTQDKLEMVESITNISVQKLVDKTQDTQDSFFTSVTPSPTQVVAENEIKATDLKFSVLSCPEFDDDAQDPEIMGIPEDPQNQDSCPETALSCPELLSSVSDAIAPTQSQWQEKYEVLADGGVVMKEAIAPVPTPKAGENIQFDEATLAGAVTYLTYVETWEDVKECMDSLRLDEAHKAELKCRLVDISADKFRCLYAEYEAKQTELKVGDRVDWDDCPGTMAGQGPFVIQEIEGATAKLDYFVPRAPLSELRLTK
jgi:hypothetical protein